MLVEEPERISGDDEKFQGFEVTCTDEIMLVFRSIVTEIKTFQLVEVPGYQLLSMDTS
jgi:hypothetical protein